MKRHFLTILVLLANGCALQDVSVSLVTDEHQSHLPTGAKMISNFITPAELDAIAREYAAQQRLAFDFSGRHAHVRIPRSREYLAEVWYDGGLGEQILSVKVGFDRQVLGHDVAIGIEGMN